MTSARITWTANPADEEISSYNVIRNGVKLGETSSTTYLDETLAQLDKDTRQAATVLDAGIVALAEVPAWDAADIQAALQAAIVDALGLKPKVAFTPLRVALTGRRVSPPLFESLELLGRERGLARLEGALA